MEALFKAKKPFKNTVEITPRFYDICGYSIEIVESSLNYLSAKGYIDLIPPDMERYIHPQAELKVEAYTYFPDLKERKFKFWLPLIISLTFSLASLVISIIAIVL